MKIGNMSKTIFCDIRGTLRYQELTLHVCKVVDLVAGIQTGLSMLIFLYSVQLAQHKLFITVDGPF